MAKYEAMMIQTASCIVEFEAPDDATFEQLEAAALEAETPTLCHQCGDRRNQSLDIDGEWKVSRFAGQPEIKKTSN